MEEVDYESIAEPRETLAYAPSLVARRPVDAAVPKVPDENGKNNVRNRFLILITSCLMYISPVDKELPATAFGQFTLPGQPTTTTTTMRPTIASTANENVVNSNQARTNVRMTPRDPVPNAPGAFAVNGPNDVPGRQDDDDNFTYTAQEDDNFTYTAQDDDNFTYTGQDDTNVDNNIHAAPVNPVKAWLVDYSKYSVRCALQFKQNVVNAIIGQPRNRGNTRVCQDSLSKVDSLVKHYKTNCWWILTLDITHYLIYSLFLKLFIICKFNGLIVVLSIEKSWVCSRASSKGTTTTSFTRLQCFHLFLALLQYFGMHLTFLCQEVIDFQQVFSRLLGLALSQH
jgi:hypothetical protein